MTLNEIREKYPYYKNATDEQLADAMYKKYYSHAPRDEFNKRIGYKPISGLEKAGNMAQAFNENVERVGKNIGLGVTELGRSLANAPHNIANIFGLGEHVANLAPTEKEFNYASSFGLNEPTNLSDKLIRELPNLLTAVALPETKLGLAGEALGNIPKVGKYINSALGNALTQSGYAAATNPENEAQAAKTAGEISLPFSILSQAAGSKNPLLSKLSKLGLAGAGAGLGYLGGEKTGLGLGADVPLAALGGLLGYRGISAKKNALNDVLQGVEGTNYKEAIEGAKRLGLSHLSPAEASGNPFAGAVQGDIGKTQEGGRQYIAAGEKRALSEKESINNLLNKIHNPEIHGEEASKLYKQAYSKSIPQDDKLLAELKDNEIFKHAEKKLENEPAFKESLKNVPKNSVAYLDHVKQSLDDMIEGAISKGNNKEARIMQKTRADLIKRMDEIAPEYKEARALEERKITANELANKFNKKLRTGSNMAKILNDENYVKQLNHHLRNVPEAQQAIKDMQLVFPRLINVPTAKTAEALVRNSMAKDRSSAQTFLQLMKEALSLGKYDKEAVKIITSPDWAQRLHELSKISNTAKFVSKAADLFGKAGAQHFAKQQKPMELELIGKKNK